MEDPPRRRQRGPLLRGVAGALGIVVAVGVLARSPATMPDPPAAPASQIPAAAPTPAPAPGTPTPPTDEPRDGLVDQPRGVWTTIGNRPPIHPLGRSVAVWTGTELLVGFTPEVGAYSPHRRPHEAWRSLPPHPGRALQVRGAVAGPDGRILVYGQKACAGCPFEPVLYELDPVAGSWQRLPDAPGEAIQDAEAVTTVGTELVVTRDRGAQGIQVLAYEPAAAAWRDLQAPVTGPGSWEAVAAGDQLVLVGVSPRPEGIHLPGAIAHDLATGTWRDVGADMPLPDPHEAAAVWTGEEIVFFGGSIWDGAPRGAALSLADDTWTALPDLPLDDQLLPTLGGMGPMTGLSGAWDGQRALFVGGLVVPVFLAWQPDTGTWEVRRATTSRAEGTAVWIGHQLLLWGGVDRRGPVMDLQAWPVRPFGR